MMRLDKPLPEAVDVDGSLYPIHTDFKFWLRFDALLKDATAKPQDFNFMYIDRRPPDLIAGVQALVAWMNPPRVLPRATPGDHGAGAKCIDYELDADFIYAAFLQQYDIDLIDTPLHWYKFTALLESLRDTKLTDIIGFRLYEPNGDKSEHAKQQERMRAAWAIDAVANEPEQDDEALEEFFNYIDEEK